MKIVRIAFFSLLAMVVVPTALLVGLANRGAQPIPTVESGDDASWDAGYRAMRDGDHETAYEFLRRVPREHPEYARAMRYCGWNVLSNRLDRPKDAVAFVHESVRTDPFDENVWEDLLRVYVRSALPFVDV